MTSFWDDETNVEKLRALWAQEPQLSTAEIGRLLKVSKNAVNSKADRLGLPGRPSPIVRDPSRRKARRVLRIKPGQSTLPTLTSLPSGTTP